MKPIEPGCLCLSLEPEFPRQCTALTFYQGDAVIQTPIGRGTFGVDVWDCDFGDYSVLIEARKLIRLDGHEPVTTEEEQEVLA